MVGRKATQQKCQTVPRDEQGGRRHPLCLVPLGDLRHPEALQFWEREGGGVQDLQEGHPSSEYTSWLKEEEAEKWI